MMPSRRIIPEMVLLLLGMIWCLPGCGGHQSDTAVAPEVNSVTSAPVSNSPTPATTGDGSFPVTVTDARGKQIVLKAAPKHIVTLTPSLTEIVYALHLGDRLVADTISCDYPSEARQKPHVDPLHPDREKIEVYAPDLVLAQAKLNSPTLIDALEHDHIPVFVVSANTLEDTYRAIRAVGEATGTPKRAESLSQQMRAQIDLIKLTVARAKDRPKVLIMYGDGPIYTTGPDSYITDVINAAGGQNIVTVPPQNGAISSSVVVERQPDVIICDPMLVDKAKNLPGWSVVPAIKNDRFFHTSNKTTLVRPGPRLPIAVEELARYLHPTLLK